MISKFSRLLFCVAVLLAGWLFVAKEYYGCFSYTSLCSGRIATTGEPEIGASGSYPSGIVVTRKTPISFGALVGGFEERFIEVAADGSVVTSGEIIGQSIRSHIGAVNQRKFSAANPLYRIHPGRITFRVGQLSESSVVSVDILSGDLGEGVAVNGVVATAGPDTSAGFQELPRTQMDRIQFQATRFMANESIDLVLGGRLELAGSLLGEVNALLHVNISVDDQHGNSGAVVVYEHVNYGGKEWSLEEGVYSFKRVKKSPVGNNRISSIRVPTGYKVIVCNGKYFSHCRAFSSSVADLRVHGFNDLTSSIKVWRY